MGISSVWQDERRRIPLQEEGKVRRAAMRLFRPQIFDVCGCRREAKKRVTIHFLPVPAIIISFCELSPFFFAFSGLSAALLLPLNEKQCQEPRVINQKSQSWIELYGSYHLTFPPGRIRCWLENKRGTYRIKAFQYKEYS